MTKIKQHWRVPQLPLLVALLLAIVVAALAAETTADSTETVSSKFSYARATRDYPASAEEDEEANEIELLEKKSDTECPPGQYGGLNRRNKLVCNPCQAGTISARGSDHIHDCNFCRFLDGYGPTDDQSRCRLCPGGTFSTRSGCKACPLSNQVSAAGSNSENECKLCGTGQIANGDGFRSGYEWIRPLTTCRTCPKGQTPSSDRRRCEPCAAGSYSATAGSETCTKCPAGHAAPLGSTDSSACKLCPAGQVVSDDGSKCEPCAAGSYSAIAGSTSCTKCPIGLPAPIGSSSASACQKCPVGQVLTNNGTKCELCAVNSYSTTPGSIKCSKCPAGHVAPIGSTSANACQKCPAGQALLDGSTKCESCAGGSYAATAGSTICTKCPIGHVTPAGSTSARACLKCAIGQSPSDDGTKCQLCAVNSYAATAGSAACTKCPAAHAAPLGSTSASACKKCQPGQAPSSDGTKCNLCASGTYSRSGAECTECPGRIGFQSSPVGSTSMMACKSAR